MTIELRIHEGTIRPSVVDALETLSAPERWASSYYLDLGSRDQVDVRGMRLAVSQSLEQQRKRLDELDVRGEVRHALQGDWEKVQEFALTTVGKRGIRSLACFIASESDQAVALRLTWPLRDRAFFEDRFVVWPLQQVLDQSDRYAIALTDKDDARLFLYNQGQIEEVGEIHDEIPGKIRFSVRWREMEYRHKHVEAFHHHFAKVAETVLRLFRREPFEHLIIGGLWETLPQFEAHLHRYLHDRLVARWDINVGTATQGIIGRTEQEERQFLRRQAEETWEEIQDQRPQPGALGPEEVFSALWGRRVQTLLEEPDAVRAGLRCTVCGRLQLGQGPCVECGGQTAGIPDIFEEAVREAIEQDAHVRYWKAPALERVDSIAASRRY